MTKVNRKSWHYWLFRFAVNYREPNNLCDYIRCIFGGMSIMLLIAAAGTVGLLAVGFYYYVVLDYLLDTHWITRDVTPLFFISAAMSAFIYIQIAYYFLEDSKLSEKDIDIEMHTPAFASLLWTYMKAGKQKICPLIEVIDK